MCYGRAVTQGGAFKGLEEGSQQTSLVQEVLVGDFILLLLSADTNVHCVFNI